MRPKTCPSTDEAISSKICPTTSAVTLAILAIWLWCEQITLELFPPPDVSDNPSLRKFLLREFNSESTAASVHRLADSLCDADDLPRSARIPTLAQGSIGSM
jgi:hypothetical protein